MDFPDPADEARHDKMVALAERMLELSKRRHSANLAPSGLDRVECEIAASAPRTGWPTPRTCSNSGRQSEKKGGGPAAFPLPRSTRSLHQLLTPVAATIAPSTRTTASVTPTTAQTRVAFDGFFCLMDLTSPKATFCSAILSPFTA